MSQKSHPGHIEREFSFKTLRHPFIRHLTSFTHPSAVKFVPRDPGPPGIIQALESWNFKRYTEFREILVDDDDDDVDDDVDDVDVDDADVDVDDADVDDDNDGA